MNIVITAPSLDPSQNVSGVSTVVSSIITYNKKHHYFHFLLGRADHQINKFSWLIRLLRQLSWFPFFVKRNRIELVHQNLPFDAKGLIREYIVNFWCRLLGLPVVLHIHGGEFFTCITKNFIYRCIATALFRYSKKVLVLSESERLTLHHKYGFSSAITLVNSIDTSLYSQECLAQNFAKPTLLFMGRITENKGVNEIVEAFSLLKKEIDFKFILCGTGSLTNYFRMRCAELLGDDFEFKGVVSGSTKIRIIQNSHLLILPSYFEGLPMVLLESMAAGVVPIVTNVGSISRVVKHNFNGLFVEKKNPESIYRQVKSIVSDYCRFKMLSDSAVGTVASEYDIKRYIEHLNHIYMASISHDTSVDS